MNFALLANSSIYIHLRYLLRCLRRSPQHIAGSPAAFIPAYGRPSASKPRVLTPHTARNTSHSTAVARPVRVVRVLEAGQARSAVGRMLISGRMVDVCAELDRLAAREIAHS
jgi:hypothetical protein